MDKIRIGVIGVGQIGRMHLDGYREIPEAEVVALCGRTEANLCRAADEYGVADKYTDYRELLRRSDIDAVDVCLHNRLHAPVAIAALRAGKHVYCEKPIAGSYADGAAMLAAAEETGKMLHIQLGGLFRMPVRAARRLVEGGAVGTIYHCRSVGHRRRGRPYVDGYGTPAFVQKKEAGGGALFDMGVYHITELLYLMDDPTPAAISGKTYQQTVMHAGRQAASGYDVEELGAGFVRFADGRSMDIFESWAAHMGQMGGSTLLGSRGGICLEPFSFHTTLCDIELDATADLDELAFRWNNTEPGETDWCSAQKHWAAALLGRVQLLPTARLALSAMLIQEGIYLSEQLGREVTAGEVRQRSVAMGL